MNLTQIAKEVTVIARAAGVAILDIYHSTADVQVAQKADNSPLTIADKAANDIICQGLSQLSVQFPIISEENKEIAYDERKDFEYYWLVDPLDGTKEFIKRNGEFTVNIALVHGSRPILGVVYAPCLDEMYWGLKGVGAFLEKDQEVSQLNIPTFHLEDAQLNIVCSRSHLNEETEAFVKQFDQPELVAQGSSLKFLIIAKGDAHVYPRLAPTMEWDTGAAQIILEEAGGMVIDEGTKQPLQYNKEILRNPSFIAYGRVASLEAKA